LAEDNRDDTPLMRQARRAAARSKTWSQAKQEYAVRVSAKSNSPFRFLSPEPAPHELGIPAGTVGALDSRTTAEIADDREHRRPAMTVAELIEFLSKQPDTTNLMTWNPETGKYEKVTGAIWGTTDGVLFLQTAPPPLSE